MLLLPRRVEEQQALPSHHRRLHNEAAQGKTQERDVEGQEGAQAGHAGGPAAGGHCGAAHFSGGCPAHRTVRLCCHKTRSCGVNTAGLMGTVKMTENRPFASPTWDLYRLS